MRGLMASLAAGGALAVVIGAVLFAAGVAALWGLWKYLRWFGRTMSAALPQTR